MPRTVSSAKQARPPRSFASDVSFCVSTLAYDSKEITFKRRSGQKKTDTDRSDARIDDCIASTGRTWTHEFSRGGMESRSSISCRYIAPSQPLEESHTSLSVGMNFDTTEHVLRGPLDDGGLSLPFVRAVPRHTRPSEGEEASARPRRTVSLVLLHGVASRTYLRRSYTRISELGLRVYRQGGVVPSSQALI